jgi:2-keto-3-deoxy-L-rhamnonate aldolase RhmA
MGFIKNRNAIEVKEMALKVLKDSNECNKPCGIMVSNITEAKEMLQLGFAIVAVTTDLVLLRNAIDEIGQLSQK